MHRNPVDGVIKYHCVRLSGTIDWSPALEQLNDLRSALFDVGLIGAYPDGVGYGNLSIRMTGNQFVITGSATGSHRTLHSDQYCLVETFSIADNSVQSRGSLCASSESMTHGAIYAANPAVHCVIHVHSRLLFDAWLREGRISTTASIPYGTPAMAMAVSALVQSHSDLPLLFAMAGHDEGFVACGADMASTHQQLLSAYRRSS
jgi:hypothetical protein